MKSDETRRGPGRPRAEQLRERKIAVRVHEDELGLIQRGAAKALESVSEYLRGSAIVRAIEELGLCERCHEPLRDRECERCNERARKLAEIERLRADLED